MSTFKCFKVVTYEKIWLASSGNKSFNRKYVSVVKSVTNSRYVHCVVAHVNTSIYALNSSADFE